MIKLKTILQSNEFYIILLIISFIFFYFRVFVIKYNSKYSINESVIEGIITDYFCNDDKYKITINGKEKVIVYYYSKGKIPIELGRRIQIKGYFNEPNNNTIFNNFNYKKYLNNHKIFYIFNAFQIKILNNKIPIKYKIKNYIINRSNKIKNGNYIKAFIIGDKSDLEEYNIYQNNGVSHLFALSGMHISLLTGIILFFIKRFKYKDIFIIFFLLFYFGITNYSASLLRSILFFILIKINDKYNFNVSIKNILLLTISILITYNPLIIYDIGFLYSSLVSLGLVLSMKFYKKNYFYNLLITSLIAFLFSLPITLYLNYEINLMSIFNNLLVVPLITFIIYPFSLIVIIIPKLSFIFNIFIVILINLNKILNIISLNIVIPKLPIYICFIYYFLLIIWIKSNNYLYILINMSIIVLFKLNIYFNNFKVCYFDVGQGDSALIMKKNNAVLIDTGEKNITGIIKYIKSNGYNYLNYLILTHGDFDHMGEAVNLVNNFKVEKVIFNCGSYNDLEQELIKVLDKKKINYYSCIKELNIDKYKLQFLNTKEYDDENDNSNVFYFNYDGYKFLFMGDAGTEKEKDILDKYNLKDIDFLKVGHHGSNTSSSEQFIDKINPKYSLISAGKNNRYGHPKEEVLETLKNSKIYRTDLDGSIEIKLNKNGYKIRTCPP